jgi:hypothetical protein
MTRGKEPPYNPEAGLPDPEDSLGHKADPEAAISQDFRNLERQLSNAAASGEKHSPMVMYHWVDSKTDLYRFPNQKAHENLLKGLVYDNPELRHKILHAMEVEEAAKKHGIQDYPVKVLLEEILSNLAE